MSQYSIYSGPSPWSKDYEGFRRVTKKRLKAGGYEHRHSGYYKKPEKKTVRLADGTTAEIYDSHLGIPLGYHGPSAPSAESYTRRDGTVINEMSSDFIDRVFDGKHKTYKVKMEDSSHIRELEYSAYYQLLKVRFWNNAVVVYFRIPSTVCGELYHLGLSNAMAYGSDGTRRHAIGIRFWDLVRIRGTLTGSRYRFEYTSNGDRSLSTIDEIIGRKKSGRRYMSDSKTIPVEMSYESSNRKMEGEAAAEEKAKKFDKLAASTNDDKLREHWQDQANQLREKYKNRTVTRYVPRAEADTELWDIDRLEDWLAAKYDQRIVDNLWSAYEDPDRLFKQLKKEGRIPSNAIWEDI